MLYIVGLGLNEKGISIEGKEAVKKCKKVYLDEYTVDYPYSFKSLRAVIGKKIVSLSREDIECEKLVSEAKKDDICLLVYGSPLFATTHIILVNDCIDKNIRVEVIHAGCIFDTVSESGLQLYKFGKVASMPKWLKNYKPVSFLDFVKQNNKINAHSLVLVDIGLDYKEALDQLVGASVKKNFKLDKILVCSMLGTRKRIIVYGKISKLKKVKGIKSPYCFIIPSKMHFLEKEIVEKF